MSFRHEVIPFLIGVWCVAVIILIVGLSFSIKTYNVIIAAILVGVIMSAYMLYFFRDPERKAPEDEFSIVAGADGRIARIIAVSYTHLTLPTIYSV